MKFEYLELCFNKFPVPTQFFCQPTSSSLLKQVSYKKEGLESTYQSGDPLPFFQLDKFLTFKFNEFLVQTFVQVVPKMFFANVSQNG